MTIRELKAALAALPKHLDDTPVFFGPDAATPILIEGGIVTRNRHEDGLAIVMLAPMKLDAVGGF
jgi:hypothetical protein